MSASGWLARFPYRDSPPQGDTIHIPVTRTSTQVRAVDLPLLPTASANPPRGLAGISSITDLPPYIAEVVEAVAQGVQTSREFATLHGISISNASERFRVARSLGWIVPVDGRYLTRQGMRYRLATCGLSA